MKRFKTKQEWDDGKPRNWSESGMNVFCGVPWDTLGGAENPYDLSDQSWQIQEHHLTDEPHPYEGRDFLITFEEGTDTDLLQKKCFVLGYHWAASSGVRKLQKRSVYIRIMGKELREGDNNALKRNSDKPTLTIQQFMDGDRLRSHPRKKRKVKADPEVKFEVKGLDLVSSQKHRYDVGDYFTFSIDEEEIEYKILKGHCYFCVHESGDNFLIFQKMKDAGIIERKDIFTKKVLGYCGEGEWPETKLLADLNKLIHAIQQLLNEYNHKSISFKSSSKTKQDGRIIKVQSVTPSITGGERREGCSISGRASRTATAVGYLSHKTVTG